MTDKKRSTAMPTVEDDTRVLAPKKSKKLSIDTDKYRPAKTRSELYDELEAREKKVAEDVFEYASPVKRGIAFVIDVAFYYSVVVVALQLAPYEFAVIKHFFDMYKIEFVFAQATIFGIFDILNVICGLYITWIIPLAFFNNSLGKKLLKVQVRGDDYYTISLSRAFQREVIFKPISLALLVGIVMPFTTKNKQSLHDRLAQTIVIKE